MKHCIFNIFSTDICCKMSRVQSLLLLLLVVLVACSAAVPTEKKQRTLDKVRILFPSFVFNIVVNLFFIFISYFSEILLPLTISCMIKLISGNSNQCYYC